MEPETDGFPAVNPVPTRTSSPCPRRNDEIRRHRFVSDGSHQARQPPSVASRGSAMVLAYGYAMVTEIGYRKALRNEALC